MQSSPEIAQISSREAGKRQESLGYLYRTLALIFVGWAAIQASRTTYSPLAGVIQKDFHITSTDFGLIFTSYFTFYVAMQTPAGILGDRFGLKRVLSIMTLVCSFGIMGMGLLSVTFPVLLVFAAMAGFGAGAFYPSAFGTVVASAPEKKRGLAAAVATAGMSLGVALGLLWASPMYTAFGNWRTAFIFLGASLLILTICVQLFIKDVRPSARSRVSLRSVLGDRRLLTLNAASFLYMYGPWVLTFWGPSLLMEKGLSAGQAGMLTAVYALVAAPVGFLLGRVSDSIGRRPVALMLFPTSAIAMAVVALVPGFWPSLLAMAFVGLANNYTWNPVLVSWAGDLVAKRSPERIGAAIGITNFFAVSPAIIGMPLSGWIRDMTGSLRYAFFLAAVSSLAGLAILIVAKKKIEGAQPSNDP